MNKAFWLLPALLLCGCSSNSPETTTSESLRSAASREVSYDSDKYTITFDSRGGSAVASQTVNAGDLAVKPTDPTKEGFYFDGWTRDEWGVIEYYFNEPVSASLTLYARWSEEPVEASSSEIIEEPIVYSIVKMPTWVTNDGCVIFAWAWGGSDAASGAWFTLTYTSKTSATFEVLDGLDGFLLARCAANTTVPNWGDTEGTGPGRVYNKTSDILCEEGVTEYECPSWVEYPERQSN